MIHPVAAHHQPGNPFAHKKVPFRLIPIIEPDRGFAIFFCCRGKKFTNASFSKNRSRIVFTVLKRRSKLWDILTPQNKKQPLLRFPHRCILSLLSFVARPRVSLGRDPFSGRNPGSGPAFAPSPGEKRKRQTVRHSAWRSLYGDEDKMKKMKRSLALLE